MQNNKVTLKISRHVTSQAIEILFKRVCLKAIGTSGNSFPVVLKVSILYDLNSAVPHISKTKEFKNELVKLLQGV